MTYSLMPLDLSNSYNMDVDDDYNVKITLFNEDLEIIRTNTFYIDTLKKSDIVDFILDAKVFSEDLNAVNSTSDLLYNMIVVEVLKLHDLTKDEKIGTQKEIFTFFKVEDFLRKSEKIANFLDTFHSDDGLKSKINSLLSNNEINKAIIEIENSLTDFKNFSYTDSYRKWNSKLRSLKIQKATLIKRRDIFEKVILNCKRLSLSQLANLLEMPETAVLNWILEQPKKYDFTIDKDTIEFKKDVMEVGIDELLKSYNNMSKKM